MAAKPTTIDDYLAKVTGEKQRALNELRRQLRVLIPKADECISYGLPAFRVDGTVVAGFAATAKGCSYYPFSGSTLANLADDLAGYSRTAGALHFKPQEPLPRALVRKLVKMRLSEV
jgi:uncharacterized protein YdhG (YjbR/CyaY superfamily)